ncbi:MULTISPECIES: glutamine synthetase family protein [unclassified Rhodococcus (in: high G+C Gram-positive bacteria)]|uniref:glutamine synthetase family protein n=1 Tax=unclassified Rhodococcus (in: high G+C Gram-positive bacteria) TaxID=192944 RepID=UPI00163A856A|nr:MULTISPECIES: glutamine synthetase family protein [unclassified Rhodococcus (in: high G+C Gram-positive bacteria)]MBC2639118.1 glutamine synthetase [Rhodococcus sp. 3A]MBC2896140.1 glutamine synthetase [Rhodococcus sp. 4CII]
MRGERDDHGRGDRIVGSIVDMAGVSRAKVLPIARLTSFVESGAGASPSWSVFCIDDHLAFTPAFSVVGDLRLRIVSDDVRDLGNGTHWAPACLTEQDGTPSLACTRGALRRVTERLASSDLTARVGHEIEFTLFEGVAVDEWAAYGLNAVLAQEEFLGRLLAAATTAELPIEQVHAEAGLNQFEVSLAPADPVRAADDAVLARALISRVARALGLRASFSPMPVAGGSGNGAHQHVSFAEGGRPLLSGGPGPHGLTEAGGAAVAGILRALPDATAVLAGSALSHLRLRPGMWSGAYRCWGLENREAAVRLCADTAGNPHGANLEIKSFDPSANPYLGTAAILGAAHDGILGARPLPDEVSVNPAELTGADAVDLLPTLPSDVLGALRASALAQDLFGPAIVEALLAVKEYEHSRYRDEPVDEVAQRFRFAWTP